LKAVPAPPGYPPGRRLCHRGAVGGPVDNPAASFDPDAGKGGRFASGHAGILKKPDLVSMQLK